MAADVSRKGCDYVFIYGGNGTNLASVNATRDSFIKILGSDGKRRVIVEKHPGNFGSNKCLQPGATLVIPGGHAYTIGNTFLLSNPFHLSRVARFIKEGKGAYVGICAGAFFASGQQSLEFTQAPSSVFYTDQYTPEEAPQIVKIYDVAQRQLMSTVWWRGSAFKETEIGPGEEGIAYYQGSQMIAALKPRKNVFLCHVHPEFQMTRNIEPVEKERNLLQSEKEELLDSAEEIQEWFKGQIASIGVAFQREATDLERKS